MPIVASGSGSSTGTVAITRYMVLATQGTGQSGGNVFLTMTIPLRASGTGQTTGVADIGIGGVVTMSASGLGTFAGRAAIVFFILRVDLGLTVGEIRADTRFTFGPMLARPPVTIGGFDPIASIADFDPVNEVGVMEAMPPLTISDFADGALIGDLESSPPVTVDGFGMLTSVGPIREDK